MVKAKKMALNMIGRGLRKMGRRMVSKASRGGSMGNMRRHPTRHTRVPIGGMVTADYRPDRVRDYYDPATGKVKYSRRG